MSQRVAVYPGSFDPPTNGHVDIVARAAKLFDRVVVGIGTNVSKRSLFTTAERIDLMRGACREIPNVEVREFGGLTVEFARSCRAGFVIRGIRALSDFEFEFEMANMNHKLAPEVEMVYFMTSPEYLFLSASRVKELVAFGASVDQFVPANVAKALTQHKGKDGLRTGATEGKD